MLLFSTLTHADLTEQIDAIVKQEPNFQGNIHVQGPSGEIFSKSYGMANVEFNSPNNRGTKFRVASVTKQFTATAILKLYADKKIKSLQDPIANYVKLPPDWNSVTFHQLLTHTAGLPRDPEYRETTAYHSLDQLFELISKLKIKPGNAFVYSNAGYELLAYLVKQIAQMDFEDYILENILKPAGLKDTSPDLDLLIVPNRARGYILLQGQLMNATGYDLSILNGSGNFISTVDDLLRWDRLLLSDTLFPVAIRDLLFQPFVQTEVPGSHYGYGWVIERWHGHNLIWHNGRIGGYASDFARFPDEGLVIISLTNRDDLAPSLLQIREKVAQLILKP